MIRSNIRGRRINWSLLSQGRVEKLYLASLQHHDRYTLTPEIKLSDFVKF